MGSSRSGDSNPKSSRIISRTLTGTVTDKADKPIANAVVYLKNTKTLAVKTVFAQNDGAYRFPELSPNVDYDIYAVKDGKKSNTKTLSQFDNREKANINLQIDTNK
ncbi:MAG TPA: carboxypeptidase-like regulatory domain-containing protein [Terriglobales bacterium]|nr:carboxypeptidase-like regulatory domain-containing protein [Terriglobales bacterium]